MFPQTDIIKKLIDNCIYIYIMHVMFGRHVFQQRVSIPMGTNCASLLIELLLYSYAGASLEKRK
jgi:hypothetical protein